jgi:hypothetical protein
VLPVLAFEVGIVVPGSQAVKRKLPTIANTIVGANCLNLNIILMTPRITAKNY